MMNVVKKLSFQTFLIVNTFIISIIFIDAVSSLRLTNMSAPEIADTRKEMSLDCHFDMGAEILYAVKWYKDDQEFFRYMPRKKDISFPVAGIHIVEQATSCGETRCILRLTNLTREHSSGAYRCEVSTEAPAFRLASETHNVTVAVLPTTNPRITGIGGTYSLGDILVAECISDFADPTPTLTWYINNQPASQSTLGEAIVLPSNQNLTSRSQPIRFRIERKHLQGSVLHLRCECTLPATPMLPLNAGQTIIVRTQPPLVNNEKLHWPNSSSLPSEPKLNVIFILLLAGLQLQQSF